MTIEQIQENMEHSFQQLGMTEQQAKRAAQGRNGPLLRRIASRAPLVSTRKPGDLPTYSGAPSPRMPSQHEISEELAKRTADLLIETHGHRLGDNALARLAWGRTAARSWLPAGDLPHFRTRSRALGLPRGAWPCRSRHGMRTGAPAGLGLPTC